MSGSSRCNWTSLTRTSTSSGGKPIRSATSAATTMPTSVWSPGKPLPMSWRRVPTSSKVRPVDPVDEAGGVGTGLEQVAVHGEAVVRVALGLVAHGRPLRQVALEQPAPVESLEGGDGRMPGGEHPHQECPQRVGPGHSGRRGLAGEQVECVPGDGQVVFGRHRGQAKGEGGVPGRVGVLGQDDLCLADGDARLTEEGPVGPAVAAACLRPGRSVSRRSGGARRRRTPRRWCGRRRRSTA